MTPLLAKVTPAYIKLLPRLDPAAQLTADDEFLIGLNGVFSEKANATGSTNQPRFYKFDQRLTFDAVADPVLLAPKSLDAVVADRAQSIVDLDRPLKLFWSGGIDSTLMVAAILPKIKHRDQVAIYHTCESLRENPLFIDHVQSFNVKTVMWSDAWSTPFAADDVVVTGTSSDEITGSLDQSFFAQYGNSLSGTWQDFFLQHRKSDQFIARCEQLFAQCPVEIQTVFDARWWFYFYIRHTYYARRDWNINLENDFEHNVVQFYNCADFDSWSMLNKHSLYGDRYSDYKYCFKQAIHDRWPNDDFLRNKEKVNSYVSDQWVTKKNAVLKQSYLFIYKSNTGFKTFRPSQYPFVSLQNTVSALAQLQGTDQ